jgi:hypothetical protein
MACGVIVPKESEAMETCVITLESVKGTGPGGAVVMKDLLSRE